MIEIALCTDNNYAMPAGVMIYSICRYSANVSFNIIISDDFSDVNRDRLKQITDSFFCQIHFINIPSDLVEAFPIHTDYQPVHISIATYYRLFLSDLLPKKIDKVIYLDCDLICLSSLEELWNTELGQAPLACVNDFPRPWQRPQERLGYDESFQYFNAGVLLINLEYWRKRNVIHDFVSFIQNYPEKLLLHDQDVLNYVFHESAVFIPPKFNATDILFHKEFLNEKFPYPDKEINEARYNPVIVHFTYKNKPWIKGGSHTYRNAFLSFMKETPWKNQRLKMKKATSIRGFVVNLFVWLGLYQYHNDYLEL